MHVFLLALNLLQPGSAFIILLGQASQLNAYVHLIRFCIYLCPLSSHCLYTIFLFSTT